MSETTNLAAPAAADPCGAPGGGNYEPAFAALVIEIEALALARGFRLLCCTVAAPGGAMLSSSTDTRRRLRDVLRRVGAGGIDAP